MKRVFHTIFSAIREKNTSFILRMFISGVYKRYNKIKYNIQIRLYKNSSYVVSAFCTPVSKFKIQKQSNRNWGDDVAYILPQLISGKKIIPNRFIANLNKDNYACIGSVIQISEIVGNNTTVWGSGAIISGGALEKRPKKVLAVRGPLTRDFLLKNGIECPEVYGDPALLFPLFYNPNRNKIYKMGIILHHSELENPQTLSKINNFLKREDVILIDIVDYGKWNYFIDKICQCEFILSSSLHGIIVADAYGVPNCWCEFEFVHPDSAFKFRDYFLSVGKNQEIPYKFKDSEDFNQIFNLKDKWQQPIINTDKLMESCPFI